MGERITMNKTLDAITKQVCGCNSICTEDYILILGDAIDTMRDFPQRSVDLICTDLPYNVTNNKWDVMIPVDKMWEQFERVLKPTGVIALTAVQPFTSILVMSNLKKFKYDLVWEKTVASGQLNVKTRPLRIHESILIFQEPGATYNEQLSQGKPYKIERNGKYNNHDYGLQKPTTKVNTGYRHAKSIIKVSNPRIKGGHPTQKPTQLMDYLVKVYSNSGDIVLDCCMGSGTTGVSAFENNRLFCGIELDKLYYETAVSRMASLNKYNNNK